MLAGILAAGTFALASVSKDTEEFVDKTISNRYEKHVNSELSDGRDAGNGIRIMCGELAL